MSQPGYLDVGDDDEDVSDAFDLGEDSRVARVAGRSAKRRKLSHTESDNSADEQDRTLEPDQPRTNDIQPARNGLQNESTQASKPISASPDAKVRPLAAAEAAAAERAARKSGVVYLSRVPPFMKPTTLRNLLSPYGTIQRVFLTPEDAGAHSRRRRAGGNAKRRFVDGWIEFASKARARACAETLNGRTVGGKKKGYYHDDVWNLRYLRGFKWDDLMEQVQGERRAREGRLRAEILRETRERKAFLGNVEAAKRERGMEAKRRKREGERQGEVEVEEGRDDPDLADANDGELGQRRRRGEMRFRQKDVLTEPSGGRGPQSEEVQRVLSKIF